MRRINQTVRQRVAETADDWERTRLYFYVSGHGIAPPTGEGAVLMADAERDVLGESIELGLYSQWYESCGVFRELVVFADCCRERPSGAPPGTLPPFNLCRQPLGRMTRVVGYATGLAELAYEPFTADQPDEQRGFFTRAVLEGLGGKAGVDEDRGGITSDTLAVFVRKRVADLTKKQPVPQQAQIIGEAGNPILLRATQVQERPKWDVTINLPGDFAGEAELRHGDRSVVERHAAGTPWVVQLDEGFYGVFGVNGQQAALRVFEVFGGDAIVDV